MLIIKDLSMDQEMTKQALAAVFGGLRVRRYSRLVNGAWRRVAYSSYRIHRVVNGRRRYYVGYHAKYQRIQTLYRGITYSG